MDYFAYGSNMLATQMQDRCPDAQHGHTAVLADHRFVINSRGVATIVASPGHVVHGVLWHVGPGDIVALDGFEGVADHRYKRTTVLVTPEGHDADQAVVYVATESEPGRPRDGYLEKVLAGASTFGLPPAYLAELAGWAGSDAVSEQ